MQIECIDMWYLKEPVVEDIGDGSQDALIIRLNLSGHIGWGECEAAPLTTVAAMFAPMSHAACKPIFYDLVGRDISGPESIKKLSSEVKRNTMDHLQAPHAWSGIEMALWDALGKAVETPVWELLGYKVSHGKRPYASSLFGETPEETYYKGKEIRDKGFFAAKFGWAQFGMKDLSSDVQQLHAAREGVGPDLDLFIDAGQIFEGRFEEAKERLSALEKVKVGDPLDLNSNLGPLVSKNQFDKVQKLIKKGIEEGANLVAGGTGRPNGYEKGFYARPTIFGNVSNQMVIAKEEIFGPVLVIIPYDDLEEAISIANDTIYGLAAYVTGEDREKCLEISRELRAGQISINYGSSGPSAPFGGYKQSGNGREKAEWGLTEFLEVKAIMSG